MVILSNLKIWNHQKRDFEIQDLEVDYNPSLIKILGNEIDCRDYLGIPPGIDLHVHFREPGFTHKEDMITGAEAALFGGVLTVLDMPNTNPVTDSINDLKYKRELTKKQDIVDILIAAAITNNNAEDISELDEYCDAYKIFMSDSSGDLTIDEERIISALDNLEELETNKPIIFHAEDPNILKEHDFESDHNKKHPPEAEAVAVQKILQWAKDYSSLKLHITHVSSSLSSKLLELVNTPNLTSDTCPRYLFFNQATDLEEHLKKVKPPLRNTRDSRILVESLAMGIIDMISSSHSPHTIEEKENECLSGMPGVQELLPTVCTLINLGDLEWERAIEAFYKFPSSLLNIKEKAIKEEIVILDPHTPFHVDSDWIKSKAGWSPFQNKMLRGSMKYIIKNKQILVQNEL